MLTDSYNWLNYASNLTVMQVFVLIDQVSGSRCLMGGILRSSDKRTLKRWFFIDKRVG